MQICIWLHFYIKTQNNILVSLTPIFVDCSNLYSENIFWEYEAEITNNSDKVIQITSEYIYIIDEKGGELSFSTNQDLKKMPLIVPGETRKCKGVIPVFTHSAIAKGFFKGFDELGNELKIEMPEFSLDSPYYEHMVQ